MRKFQYLLFELKRSYIFSYIICMTIPLRTIMYQSAEARPGPSQVSKINSFARIVNVFKLTLLTIFVTSTVMDV